MKKGIILTAISALMYGFTPILGYITFQMGNDAITLTFFRNLFVIPVLLLVIVIKKKSIKIAPQLLLKLASLSVFGALMTTVLLYSSYSYISVGTSTTLHFLYPLFVLIISKLVYKDQVSSNQILAILVSLLGIALFIDLNDLGGFKGIIYALLSGVFYGLFVLLIEKWKLTSIDSYVFSFYISVFITVVMLLVNGSLIHLNFSLYISTYMIMFVVAIMASFIGVLFLKEGIQLLGPSLASMICLIEPISAMIFGIVFLRDKIVTNHLYGSILIILSMWILSKPNLYMNVKKKLNSSLELFKK